MTENYGLLIGLKEAPRAKVHHKRSRSAVLPLLACLGLATVLYCAYNVVSARENGQAPVSDADYQVAKRLFQTAHTAQDSARAASLIASAARQGDPKAQTAMAILSFKGSGVRQDSAAGVTWLRKAAKQGFAVAQNELGILYATGKGVPQDFTEATRWCGLAAQQGNKEAQQNVLLLEAARRDLHTSLADLGGKPSQNLAVQRCSSDGVMVAFEPAKGGLGLAMLKSEKVSQPLQQLCGMICEKATSSFEGWALRNGVMPALGAL